MTSVTTAAVHVLRPLTGMPHAPRIESRSLAPGDIAVGVVIGRASEYFDFFVYGIASVLVFPSLFFPFVDRLQGTLYAFALLALAFVMRPLGTLLGMVIQRRWGRTTKLTVALFALGCATVGMALLPGTEAVGAWMAVSLLTVCRIGQGLAVGASWDGLPSLLALNAPERRRGWYAMLGQLGAPLGFIMASSMFAYLWRDLSAADFIDWGWRYPFFAAFAINVVGLFARLRLVMTREYECELQARELDPCDTRALFNEQGHHVLVGAFAALASYALFHLVTVFPLSWVMLHSPQAIGDFLSVELMGAVLCASAMPMSGLMADRIGRRRTLGVLALLIAAFSLLTPWLLGGGPLAQDAFILLGFVLLGLSYGQAAGAVASNFLPKFRYTGAALSADLAWLVGAAFAPLLALILSVHFGLLAVSAYLMTGALATLLALRLNRSWGA